MAAIDLIVKEAIEGVKKSGALEAGALLATVSGWGPVGGTIAVTRGPDTYPQVRYLTNYAPSGGDLVLILKTNGGWVCLGKLAS